MRRSPFLAVALLGLGGCGAGWHRFEPTPDRTLAPRDQYLIHHGDSADRWHAVQVSADSVAGIPWLQPIECDSCRIALPRASVDSIRAGHPVRGFWRGYALAVYGPAALLVLICTLGGHPGTCNLWD